MEESSRLNWDVVNKYIGAGTVKSIPGDFYEQIGLLYYEYKESILESF